MHKCKCGGRSRTIETRTEFSHTRRVRKCTVCGRRWSTAEIPLEKLKLIKKFEDIRRTINE